MRWSLKAQFHVAPLLLLLACGEDPVGPYHTRVQKVFPIYRNDTLTAKLSGGDSLYRYVFHADTTQMIALFAQARRGTAVVWTIDSATSGLLDYLFLDFSPFPVNLTGSRTPIISVVPGQVLYFDVHLGPGPTETEVALWLYPVDTRPEVLPPALAPGAILSGETLENSADIDAFVVSGSAPDVHIAFLKAGEGFPPGTLRMQASTSSGAALGIETASGTADQELEGQPTGRFDVPGSAGYALTIRGVPTTLEGGLLVRGAYQFQVRKVNPGPDSVVALLQPGDTVEKERIDHVGDVDQFRFLVVQGRPYNVFFQAPPSAASANFRIAYSMTGGVAGAVTSSVGDTLLREQSGGSFVPTVSGYLELEVTGASDLGGLDRGRYRLFVYAVDTLPEHVAQTLAPGDSVVGESIELPGDIDRFMVTGAFDTMNVALRRSGLRFEPIALAWSRGGFENLAPCYGPDGTVVHSCLTGRFIGGPTGTPLGVHSMVGGDPGDFVGPYTLRTYRLSGATEGSNPQLTPGVTVTGVVDPAGDIDRFTFSYVRDTPVDVLLTGGGNSTDNSLEAVVHDPDGNGISAVSWADIPTGRFSRSLSGTYTVEVRGLNGGIVPDETGSYSLLLRTVSTMPETASPTLVMDDSVGVEALDELGDIDDFTLNAAPGTEVVATISPALVRLEAWEPSNPTRLDLGGATGHSGRIVVPAGGQIRVRVSEPRRENLLNQYTAFRITGAYGLVVHEVNRAPETAPIPIAVGVEVSVESIDSPGDVDEFTLAGIQGQSISAFLDNLASHSSLRVRLEVIDPSTSQVLISAETTSRTPVTSSSVTLPATRTYLVRTQSVDPTDGVGSYRFRLQ